MEVVTSRTGVHIRADAVRRGGVAASAMALFPLWRDRDRHQLADELPFDAGVG
jgi:hypothetical protein